MTYDQAVERWTELEQKWDREGVTLAEAQELTTLRYDVKNFCPSCETLGTGVDRYDARGIYLQRCCDECWKDKRKGYRPEVLTDPGYRANEQIEEDY